MPKAKAVRSRVRKVVDQAKKQAPSIAILLEMVKGFRWVAGEPPTAPFNGDSTGDAQGYLSSYEFRLKQ